MRNRLLAILVAGAALACGALAASSAALARGAGAGAARSAVQGEALSGPVEFGRSELDRAIAGRRLNPRQFSFKTQVAVDPAESYRIVPGLITGGDLRGLMYGLLEAADQVRKSGRLRKVEATPGMAVRGARVAIDDFAGDMQWFYGREQWPPLFRTLAIDRFNQFQIAVPDLAGAGSEQNLDALHFISDTAAEYGIDFTLGVGIRQALEGPDLYAALLKVLADCPDFTRQSAFLVRTRGGDQSVMTSARAMVKSWTPTFQSSASLPCGW